MRASFKVSERDTKNNIVYLEDRSNKTGGMSITNDAENIVDQMRSIFGNRIRIVYKDTDNEWWQIVWSIGHRGTYVAFKPWAGLAWEILSRKEN